MELDLKYLDEWSLWLDLKILAMTIPGSGQRLRSGLDGPNFRLFRAWSYRRKS